MDPSARGWQVNKSVMQCHRHMLENRIACDIKIRFGQSSRCQLLEAHRYILICRSPVFEAMLTGEFMEKSHIITVTDVECDVFYELLRYMYCDEPILTNENVLDVLYTAEKYLVGGLIDKCNQFLTEHIATDNVCSIINHSLLYNERSLFQKCVEYVSQNCKEIFGSEDFMKLTSDSLFELLAQDEVGLLKELDIARACFRWARKKQRAERERCGVRSVRETLGRCLTQIRFGSMNSEELGILMSESTSVLTKREQAVCFSYISDKSERNRKALEAFGFNSKPRRDMFIYVVQRFLGHSCANNKWGAGWNSPDTITFQVDMDVNFMGVSVFAGYAKGDTHALRFCLKQMMSGTEECTVEQTVISDGTAQPVDILVNKPLKLQQYLIYKIEIHRIIPGPNTFYGINGKEKITVEGRTFTFTDFCTRNNGTCVREGQIPRILFTKL